MPKQSVAAKPGPARHRKRRKQERRFTITVPDGTGGAGEVHWRARKHLSVPGRLQSGGLATYEPETLACFLAVLDHAVPGPVWDIGANVGVYAVLAASASDREVVAFEPTPLTAAVARRVSRRNELGFEVLECALGDVEGEVSLYLSTSSDSSNSTAAGFREAYRTLTVPATSVDALVRSGRTPPAVLKVDTETTEPQILRGAEQLLRSRRPWILCEALPGRTEPQLMEVMRPHGYTWHLIEPTVPYPARDPIEGHVTHYMWLFAPEPIPDAFWDSVRDWQERLRAYGPAVSPPAAGQAPA